MIEEHLNLPATVWEPREYQLDLWLYLRSNLRRGGQRADVVAHRRWGKDEVGLHWAALAASQRTGTYWHLLPEASQGRKAIWRSAMRPEAPRWSPVTPRGRSPCKRMPPSTRSKIKSRRRAVSPRAELAHVVADVRGPGRGQQIKAGAIVGEEGAGRFLVAGEIAAQGGHDPVGHLLRLTLRVRIDGLAPRLIDKPPQSRRRAAGLACEPVPMARQEGDLPGCDAELWASAGGFWRAGGNWQSGEDLLDRASQVELHRPAGRVFEDEWRRIAVFIRGARDGCQVAPRD